MSNHSQTYSNELFSKLDYSEKQDGPIIVTYKLKSPENMGHIIRLASNFGCRKIVFIGNKDEVRASKIKKVAGAAFSQVDWAFYSEENWLEEIPGDYSLVGIETDKSSKNLAESKLPEKMAVFLGNEIHGIPVELLKKCESVFHIPMLGKIKSMNVSHACSVAIYQWVFQHANTNFKV